MAKVSRTETWDCPIERIYDVLIDYNSYKEFVDGVSAVEVHESSEQGARVTLSLNLIKKFSYTIKLVHDRPQKVSWSLESGDLFKKNDGQWDLKKISDDQTEVTYSLDVDVKGLFVPKSIVSKLTSNNLPAMMKSYHDRIRGH
jgi:ribosome-associated toxin RatA of RatAB toxin-antitoxin module